MIGYTVSTSCMRAYSADGSPLNMAARQLVFSCFVSVILFSSSTYAFLDGLYCGAENCYDGKDFSFFSLPYSFVICDFELITTKLIHIWCTQLIIITVILCFVVLGVVRESSKVKCS